MWHASQSWIHHQFIVSRSAKIAQMASYLSENALVQMISYSFYPCHSHCAFFSAGAYWIGATYGIRCSVIGVIAEWYTVCCAG